MARRGGTPKERQVNVRVDDDMFETLEAIAHVEDKAVSELA